MDMKDDLTSQFDHERLNNLQEELSCLQDLVSKHRQAKLSALMDEVRPLAIALVKRGEDQCMVIDKPAEPVARPYVRPARTPRPRQPLTIPQFDGRILKWAGYWTFFQHSLITT